jgi:hypothetical protein
MSYNDCTFEELGSYEENLCYFPKGGAPDVFVLKEGHGITDFSNATQVQAAITAGDMVIMTGVKGALPEPSAVEGENPVACGSETIVDGYDYTYEVINMNVNAVNDLFMSQLNQSQFSGIGWRLCDQHAVRVVEQTVSFNARLVQDVSNKVKDRYLITVKWYQPVTAPFPVLFDEPAGIFD